MEYPITIEYDFIAGSLLPKDRHRSIMRRMGVYSGGVMHVQLTIPKYLIDVIDRFTTSRSAYITLAVEKQMRMSGLLHKRYPSLGLLYRTLVHMDLFAMRFKSTGGQNRETVRMMRAYRAFFKRFERMMKQTLDWAAGFGVLPFEPHAAVKKPYTRTRPDRRRQTDSDSKKDLGSEAHADETDKKNEIWRTDRDKFRQMWPSEYNERLRQDEQRIEDERQDPPDWKEDGDDPPEN